MQQFIDKLISRLEEYRNFEDHDNLDRQCIDGAIEIVNQLAEEYKPRTNADRIRSMDDAELERILREQDCRHCSFAKGCCIGKSCRDGTLEWLQSEVKDGE